MSFRLSSEYEIEYNDEVQKLFGYPGELDFHSLKRKMKE